MLGFHTYYAHSFDLFTKIIDNLNNNKNTLDVFMMRKLRAK